jgi:OsmC-like protein
MLKSYSYRARAHWTQDKRGIVEGETIPRNINFAAPPEFDGVEVPVEGKIEKLEGGFRFTKITLRPEVTIPREEDRERTGRVLEKAERVCLVSRSLNSAVVLEPTILIAPLLPSNA